MADERQKNWFIWVISLMCLAVVAMSFYQFFFKKNYDFIVETACDPSIEECFARDCSDPELCPPNQLSEFKRYSLNASDFKMCENEDCTYVCAEEVIQCEQIECTEDPEFGEYCISPESAQDTEEAVDEESENTE